MSIPLRILMEGVFFECLCELNILLSQQPGNRRQPQETKRAQQNKFLGKIHSIPLHPISQLLRSVVCVCHKKLIDRASIWEVFLCLRNLHTKGKIHGNLCDRKKRLCNLNETLMCKCDSYKCKVTRAQLWGSDSKRQARLSGDLQFKTNR